MKDKLKLQRIGSLLSSCRFFNFTLTSSKSFMSDVLSSDEVELIDSISPLLSKLISHLSVNYDAQMFVDSLLRDINDGIL